MHKFYIFIILLLSSNLTLAENLTCYQLGIGINPSFTVESYDGITSKKVTNNNYPDKPFTAIVEETASDTLTYTFPSSVQDQDGYLALVIRTLGIETPDCKGKSANLIFRDLSNKISPISYCCN